VVSRAPRLSFKLLLAFEASLGLLGFTLIVLLGIERPPARINWPLAGLLGLLAGWLSYVLLLRLSQWAASRELTRKLALHQIYRFFRPYAWPRLIVLAMIAGLGEEWLFRVAIQSGLSQYLGPWVALALTSVLFGLAHYLSAAYFLFASGFGLLLGLGYLLTDSFLLVASWHAAYDALALCLLRYRPQALGVYPSEPVSEQ